jgi:thiol-disulfide isomerase/thioredoxin
MKIFIYFLIPSFFIMACQKDESIINASQEQILQPVKEKHVLVMEQTGAWCGACPNGARVLDSLKRKYGSSAIPFAIHVNDVMEPDCKSSFRSDRQYSSFPSFFITEARISAIQSTCENAVEAKLTTTIEAASDFKVSFIGDSIDIETKTEFYENGIGNYYLAAYVLEDSIFGGSGSGSYKQTSGSSNYYHQHVLRNSSTGNQFWGDTLTIDPTAGMVIDRKVSIYNDATWIDKNLHVIIVLWKETGTTNRKYVFVNAKSHS